MPALQRPRTNGVLVIDKPKGITSRAVTTRIKRLLNEKKTGHLGTLDPLATGVLPIILGKANRLVRFLEKGDKEYIASVRLGVTTTTLDAEGEVVASRNVNVSEEEISEFVKGMTGEIEQKVPKYSAAKHKGKPLYEYARRGEEVGSRTKRVVIHEIEIRDVNLPEIEIRVICSPGTYIRALAADLGEKLGCGAHLSDLRRTRSGEFTIEQAVPLEDLTEEKALEALLPLQSLLSGFPEIPLTEDQAAKIRDGKRLPAEEFTDITIKQGILYRMMHEKLFAIADTTKKDDQLALKPVRVIHL